jgi:molybdenum cofactor cytidylyltransferase
LDTANAETSHIHVVVLAAGASTRFGATKQLVRVGGRPLMHIIVSRAVELAGHSVTVVLGAHAAELAPLLNTARLGRGEPGLVRRHRQFHSRRHRALRQPRLTASDRARRPGRGHHRGSAAARGRVAAQSQFHCRRAVRRRVGVPAIFPRWCFRELNELRGDRGAQSLLQRHVDRLVRLAMPSAELDIDRPEDLLTLEVGTQVKRQQLTDS